MSYDANLIKTAFLGTSPIIGWKQNIDPAGVQLQEMTTSSSGLWFNGVHPMLTIDNLFSICPELEDIDDATSAVNTAFTKWLKEKTEDGIVQALAEWNTAKAEMNTSVNILERMDLFDQSGSFTDLEVSTSDIVGFEISPAKSKSLVITAIKIGLQFDTNQDIVLKLFKAGQKDHVETKTVTYTGNGSIQWETINWKMSGEGLYYIAYDQNLIAGSAINGIHNYGYDPRYSSFPTGKYFGVVSFKNNASDMLELWEIKDNSYTVGTNYGLNLKIVSGCEYTSLIEEQVNIFASAVSLQVGMNFLLEMAYNPNSRVNRNAANMTRKELLYEIHGDTQGRNSHTVSGKLTKALKAIQFDASGLDEICLPCRRKSVQYKSLGLG